MSATITELLPAVPLTTDDRAALKAADDWSLHLSPHSGSIINLTARGGHIGNDRIWTVREQMIFPDTPGREYGSSDRQRTIHVDVRVFGYGNTSLSGGWRWSPSEGIDRMPSCFAMSPGRELRTTVCEALRNGDVLELVWAADNNSQTVEEAGLHIDDVRLVIKRENKNDRHNPKRLTHKLITSVTLDNSARMIRRPR